MKRKQRRRLFASIVVLLVLSLQLYVSNPYLNIFYKPPFVAGINKEGQMALLQKYPVFVVSNPIVDALRFIDAGARIGLGSLDSETSFKGSVDNIISQIHLQRFNPSKPYLISGGHFSDLYLRNLGIFYSGTLDGCIASNEKDWENREEITTQSLVLSLALLQKVQVEPTTFSPLFPNIYIPSNVYTRASDSLYGVLYTLSALHNPQTTEWQYTSISSCHRLQTQQISSQLLSGNKANLTRLLVQYQKAVMDPKTGLVRADTSLSSARDGVKRQSSFYDNVIAWATMRLAQKLGLMNFSQNYFSEWKNRIIARFWVEKNGLFLNDLSLSSQQNHTFSGDEFIALQTQFLDIKNAEDIKKLKKMIGYVEKRKLDMPFPLRYSAENPLNSEYFFVRFAVPSYMGNAIWSHWGMEYIQALILTGQKEKAKQFLHIYSQKILQYGGYPEVYNTNGNILHAFFYKSLLHTGWVINFEEARQMLATMSRS